MGKALLITLTGYYLLGAYVTADLLWVATRATAEERLISAYGALVAVLISPFVRQFSNDR